MECVSGRSLYLNGSADMGSFDHQVTELSQGHDHRVQKIEWLYEWTARRGEIYKCSVPFGK